MSNEKENGLTADEIKQAIEKSWEEINKQLYHNGGVNPYAYNYGFKAGCNFASLKTADLQKQLSEKEKECVELKVKHNNQCNTIQHYQDVTEKYAGKYRPFSSDLEDYLKESQYKANKLAEAATVVNREYAQILKIFNYERKIKGEDEMDYQSLSELNEALSEFKGKENI